MRKMLKELLLVVAIGFFSLPSSICGVFQLVSSIGGNQSTLGIKEKVYCRERLLLLGL